jgi:hypothetical protein
VALVLAFGVVLLVSVSLSGVAARTVLSTALLFLVAGALIGPGGLAIVHIGPDDPIVSLLADIALFTVLFTDGQRANLSALKQNWSLSGRSQPWRFSSFGPHPCCYRWCAHRCHSVSGLQQPGSAPRDLLRWSTVCWPCNPASLSASLYSILSVSQSPYPSCCTRPPTCRSRGCCASNPPTSCPRADQLLMSPPTPRHRAIDATNRMITRVRRRRV